MPAASRHDASMPSLGPPLATSLKHDLRRVCAVVLIATVAGFVIEPWFEPANLIMVYLSGVVYVALRSARLASLAAVGASILAYDWIFVPPRWSLKPTDPQYYFAFLVMFAVGLMISELAGRARHEALVADARARRSQAQNALATMLARARTHEDIAQSLCHAVQESLGLPSRLMLRDAQGALVPVPDAPWADADFAGRLLADAGRADAVVTGPGKALYVPVRGSGEPLGVIAVPQAEAEVNSENREMLAAFASQVAIAVERSLYERRSAQAAVAAEAERLRNTLLSGLSHDFRTPLTTIVGAASSLLEQAEALDADRQRSLLHGIVSEAQRMHVTTSTLLELTRMEEGAVEPRCEWCPADELVQEVVVAMGHRLGGHRVRLHVDPDAVVWCDPPLVEQVLTNLLDNAARHAPADEPIDVTVTVADGTWSLVVADRGPGLPSGEEQEVFRKFYRPAAAAGKEGTGLGLALCAAIARLHGGSITGRNDAGARITMTLPQPVLAAGSLDR